MVPVSQVRTQAMASDVESARAGEPARASAVLRVKTVSALENLERDIEGSFWPAAALRPPRLEEEPSVESQDNQRPGGGAFENLRSAAVALLR